MTGERTKVTKAAKARGVALGGHREQSDLNAQGADDRASDLAKAFAGVANLRVQCGVARPRESLALRHHDHEERGNSLRPRDRRDHASRF